MMGFTGLDLETATIDRSQIADPRSIEVDDFVGMQLDYSKLGDTKTQAEQLYLDYQSVGYRSEFVNRREEVNAAFKQYIRRIHKRK